jgi:hypothetical protein
MKYTVMTAARAAKIGLNPSRCYGYVVRITPPVVTVKTGEDVEGIGWCPMPPRKQFQNFFGWYKYKADAIRRSEELKRSEQRRAEHDRV